MYLSDGSIPEHYPYRNLLGDIDKTNLFTLNYTQTLQLQRLCEAGRHGKVK